MTTSLETDFTRLFTEATAQYVADAGIGISWQTNGKYATGLTGIFIAAQPTTPNRIVTFTPTLLSSHPTLPNDVFNMQIRSRAEGADIRDAWLIDDAIANLFNGNWPRDLPNGIHVNSVQRTSGSPAGQDASLRWMVLSNYMFDVMRPNAHRP